MPTWRSPTAAPPPPLCETNNGTTPVFRRLLTRYIEYGWSAIPMHRKYHIGWVRGYSNIITYFHQNHTHIYIYICIMVYRWKCERTNSETASVRHVKRPFPSHACSSSIYVYLALRTNKREKSVIRLERSREDRQRPPLMRFRSTAHRFSWGWEYYQRARCPLECGKNPRWSMAHIYICICVHT